MGSRRCFKILKFQIFLAIMYHAKIQLIPKCLFSIGNSPKIGTKKIPLYYYGTSNQIIIVRFMGELKAQKKHFEIN